MVQPDVDLPATWAWVPVSDIGSVRLGRHRSPDKLTGRYPTPYLRAANITPDGLDLSDVKEMDFSADEVELFRLRKGDILLTEGSGSPDHLGVPALWSDEIEVCCFQNHLIRFRPHAVTPDYALLVFQQYARSGRTAELARGVGILHIGSRRFAQMSVPLPPANEQARIVDEASRRRTELRAATTSLRRALQHITSSRDEVLRRSAEGGLLPLPATHDTAADANADTLQASEAGDLSPRPWVTLPPDWSWIRVDEAGDVQLGKAREPSSHTGPNMKKYLRVANVQEDAIDLSDLKEMHFTEDETVRYGLQHGDILLNEGQSLELVGRAAMFRGDLEGLCFQKTLLRFRARAHVVPEFALLVFRSYLHSGHFQRIARASTNIAHLSRQRFCAMPFPLPPVEQQERIVATATTRLNALSVQAAAIRASIEKVAEMTDELLAGSVAGRLVPQDPHDAPATAELAVLQRATSPETHSISPPERQAKGEVDSMPPPREIPATTPAELATVARGAGGPIALPELMRLAGFDVDETEDLEQFYLVLRSSVGITLRVASEDSENAFVEAADNAP